MLNSKLFCVWSKRRFAFCVFGGNHADILHLVASMSTDSSKGFSLNLAWNGTDVEHRKQQGLRHNIRNCVAVDYRCASLDERKFVSTTVLDPIFQDEQRSKWAAFKVTNISWFNSPGSAALKVTNIRREPFLVHKEVLYCGSTYSSSRYILTYCVW